MSVSSSTIRQEHTVLGGGRRYETAELILLTIPNFELKQKGRILQFFTEVRRQRILFFIHHPSDENAVRRLMSSDILVCLHPRNSRSTR